MQHPGWYPSPTYPGQLQYWNGDNWTPQIKPLPAQADSFQDSPPPTGLPYESQNATVSPVYRAPINIKPKWALRMLAGILFFAGLIPLAITLPGVVESLAGNKTEVVGKVVSLDYSTYTKTNSGRSKSKIPSCSPIAEYVVNGTPYTTKASVYTAPCPHKIGESITVKYDNSNPAKAHVKASGAINAVVWGFFTAGALLTLAGVGVIIKSFMMKKEQ